eukprot:m.169404 g.169404  ORF g.169404 m.169404 type:complete len:89 (+) comp13095_c0_seq1:65-331(+)
MASYQNIQQKKEEYRVYLEKQGVIDALTKGLVDLYEQPEKPANDGALEFLKNALSGGADPKVARLEAEIEKLKQENEELKAKVAELEQ